MAYTIAVASGKGGVTKTATCQELGASFTNMGYKVLCIDMDMQTDLTVNSAAEVKNTIVDVFEQTCPIPQAIQHTEFYDIIAGDPRLQNAEKLYTERDDIYLLADVIEVIDKYYDYIIIDNHPDRAILNIMSFVAADYVITPTLADSNSLKGVVGVANDLKKMREGRNKESHAYIIAIILNIFKRTTTAHRKKLRELEEFAQILPGNVIVETVRESVKVTEARDLKEPMQKYDRFNNVSIDYRRIAKKIDEEIENGKE